MNRKIYAVTGVSAEVAAYGMAKYSRSSQSMADSMAEISEQKASDFLNTFYFKYGHASIADMAHILLGIEGVSILAAMTIVDEPLWDGQERSTRYQDFSKREIHMPLKHDMFNSIVYRLFNEYEDITMCAFENLCTLYKKPHDMSSADYNRTMKARAFDVSRYFLPLATKTSLGQITSARTLEKQISRLMSSPYSEIFSIAHDLKDAVTVNNPVTMNGSVDTPVAQTLVKHASIKNSLIDSDLRLEILAKRFLHSIEPNKKEPAVVMHTVKDIDIHTVTCLLYSVSNLSYQQIYDVVSCMHIYDRNSIISEMFDFRGKHDDLLRQFQSGPLVFDIMMDIGSFRDFNRHRRAMKILQPLTHIHGADSHEVFETLQMDGMYTFRMDDIFEDIADFCKISHPTDSTYLLPLGTRCRSLFQMDISQLAYMTELRTGSAGHFSYREIAYQMWEVFNREYPHYGRHIRVTNPRTTFDPFKR